MLYRYRVAPRSSHGPIAINVELPSGTFLLKSGLPSIAAAMNWLALFAPLAPARRKALE